MNNNYDQVNNNPSGIDKIYIKYDPESELSKQSQPLYENVNIDSLSSQNRLLRKLFRNAGKPDAIYENLCRGCGYGVFEAKSNLCHFCTCVVRGLKNNQLQHSERSRQMYANTGENIYENICFKCSALYNTEECEFCLANESITTVNKIEDTQLEKMIPIKAQAPIKIQKSKTFHKFDKQNLINGIFGSLKRGVIARTNVANRQEDRIRKQKQLDIVHHVDGYENIFRTNKTFDLQKICELKKAQKLKSKVSTSDQHIYGRLKMNDSIESNTTTEQTSHIYLSKSHEQLQVCNLDYLPISSTSSSVPNTRQTLTCSRKRPCISKPCFLGSRPKFVPDYSLNQPNAKLALPLSDSVCYWMKLLRNQVCNYHSYGASYDDEQHALCIPKSIPSKSVLMNTYYGTGSSLINFNLKAFPANLEEIMTHIPVVDKKGDFEIPILINNTNSQADSICKIINENMENCFAGMVDVFKRNIMTKHMLYHQRELEPSVEHSSTLNSIPQADYLIRSKQKHTKYQTIYVKNENKTAFNCAPEHSPISVINSKYALSTVAVEKCLTSCCSACYVDKGQSDRCGYLNVGDFILRAPDSELQHQTVTSVKKSQNEKAKAKTQTIIKTETVDAYNNISSAVASRVNEEKPHVKQDNYFSNIKHNIGNSLYVVKETNSVQQVSCFSFPQLIEIPYTKVPLSWNVLRLKNNLLISFSLNKIILYSCSNRSQYFDWFQDWLLCYYNPWSFKAKRALKVIVKCNSFDIAYKLCTLMDESVQQKCNCIWKYGKQGERFCVGKIPISVLNSQIFMKYYQVTLQSEQENDAVFNERKSERLIVRISVGKYNPMKTNDEVILRPKSKDTFERSTKAQGKFLDLYENVAELNQNGSKLSKDKHEKNLETNLESSCEKSSPFSSSSGEIEYIDIQNNCHFNKEHCVQEKEEDIYQPIWEFHTVGNCEEHYESDSECYNATFRTSKAKCLMENKSLKSEESSIPSLLISNNVEDHGDWETDDEFMFSKKFHEYSRASSHKSSSTITSFDNSTIDIDSSTGLNLQHPLLRTVCIYFSLTEPKIRAIVYDYDRGYASQYFKKNTYSQLLNGAKESIFHIPLSMGSPSTHQKHLTSSSATFIKSENGEALPTFNLKSVQAWKLTLLNAPYTEDEEDLIVSESEILRSQSFKEETENNISHPKTATLKRFKSASFDNLLEIPREDDKKSITERMRNKLQRGVFKLNMRSEKSEKKGNGIFRPVKTGSLYLEDGMRPKYPIFGAQLDQLEMNESLHQQVPRFLMDCVSYIERKEYILQDGLYRASGNKLAIDELKQKLSESYIYDSKLLVADDIHTITSLLKQFFRELGTPLIPQLIYDRICSNILESAGIEMLRNVLEEVPDPNRSTLKFLIRHLKNVAAFSMDNRMPASNLAIVWGPCIFSANQLPFVDIGRMNTLTKLLIENYDYIFRENERLVN